jgi:hypothetical protein
MENKIYLSQQQSRMKTFALAIFSLLLVGQAFAAPLPLQTIVNDDVQDSSLEMNAWTACHLKAGRY